MNDIPITFSLPAPQFIPDQYDSRTERRLSDLRGYFADERTYESMLAREDTLLYEVYEVSRPHQDGEMLMGVSVIHPGKVGDEFFMTKGHFHAVLDTAEVYLVMSGEGCMVMETPEGQTAVEWLTPGKVLYVPPRWAHRAVCTGRQEPLVIFFVYPAHAGHDYATIQQSGFCLRVVEDNGCIQIVNNSDVNGR